ncbi:hypothetical protein C8255_00355 [filamentous cyanobacterium CCP3]|nr:hypothetical protein C8255_00355 [filamentous cyanobacterium CCP3]
MKVIHHRFALGFHLLIYIHWANSDPGLLQRGVVATIGKVNLNLLGQQFCLLTTGACIGQSQIQYRSFVLSFQNSLQNT